MIGLIRDLIGTLPYVIFLVSTTVLCEICIPEE